MAHILVVDDNEDSRDLLALILREDGHTVAVAGDGDEAIERYHDRASDVVVLDLLMPKRDGFAVLTTLRAECPGVQVLVISGAWKVGTRDALAYARELGADVTLRKPVDPELVRRAVQELLTPIL